MSDDETSTLAAPAMYGHICKVYNAMLQRAMQHATEGGVELVVYEGRLVALITEELYFSVPYYTSIMQALKKLGCVRQLRRGGGSSPSQWEMIKEPELDAFLSMMETDPGVARTTGRKGTQASKEDFEEVAQQLRDLRAEFAEHVTRFDGLVKIVADMKTKEKKS
jgi:hypothetical protein